MSHEDGCDRAVDLLRRCSSARGFVASVEDRDNYHRVWSRDGAIMGLAALLTGDPELIVTFRGTLETLADFQGPHGEIPSNVDPRTRDVSYGGTAGRVDADLWFGVAVVQYARATGDHEFLLRMRPVLDRVRFLLGAWEFNNRGLLYVPQTGDWTDEFVQNGYVLYDQLLYVQFQREMEYVERELHGTVSEERLDRRKHLVRMIRTNYWFEPGCEAQEDVYHEGLYERGCRAGEKCRGEHWMSFFSPLGYGYRFDALANVLVSLLHVADDGQASAVETYIEREIRPEGFALLPAFHPVITRADEDWDELQATFSYSFKNEPYQFHNGGLWPMVTGFYAADLARRGRDELARTYLEGIDRANALDRDGTPWRFPEYVHGKEFTPGGTLEQGWSAAAAVIAHETLRGKPLFRGEEHERDDPDMQ